MLFKSSSTHFNSIRKLLFLFILMAAVGKKVQCQQRSVQELKKLYEKSGADTNAVRILLSLDTIYLYRMPDIAVVLDSALLMAKQAKILSNKLGFEQGNYEATFLMANAYAEKNDMASAQAIANNASGPLKVHIFIMIGERYLYRPGELKQNLDSAYIFIAKAKVLSESISSTKWLYESLCLLGKYYFATGQLDKGKSCFIRMIKDYQDAGNIEREAFWWSELGNYMPDSDSTYSDEVNTLQKALQLYQNVNLAHLLP